MNQFEKWLKKYSTTLVTCAGFEKDAISNAKAGWIAALRWALSTKQSKPFLIPMIRSDILENELKEIENWIGGQSE